MGESVDKKYKAKNDFGFKESGDTMLEMLDNASILSVEKDDVNFFIQEQHSCYFGLTISPEQLAVLGLELIEMSGCIDRVELYPKERVAEVVEHKPLTCDNNLHEQKKSSW